MIDRLQEILNVLEKINNSLSSPIIAPESIKRERYHLSKLKENEQELENLLNELEKANFKDEESTCKALLPLYHHIRYISQVAETIYKFTSLISTNYAHKKGLTITD